MIPHWDPFLNSDRKSQTSGGDFTTPLSPPPLPPPPVLRYCGWYFLTRLFNLSLRSCLVRVSTVNYSFIILKNLIQNIGYTCYNYYYRNSSLRVSNKTPLGPSRLLKYCYVSTINRKRFSKKMFTYRLKSFRCSIHYDVI